MASSNWATTQLSHILPLDQESLEQIIHYTSTLPKDAAAEHLKNFLGDSPKALEFISSFNARRDAPTTISPASAPAPAPASIPAPSEGARKTRKKKPPLNKLPPPRRPEDYGNTLGAYQKKDEEDYMSGSKRPQPKPALANTLALSDQPDARQLPMATPATSVPASKPPPSASGHLISDLPNVRSGSRTSSRTSSPAPKTKINVVGGTSMHGASTTLQDLVSRLSPSRRPHLPKSRTLQYEVLSSKQILLSPPTPHPAAAPVSQPVIPSLPPPPTVSIAAR